MRINLKCLPLGLLLFLGSPPSLAEGLCEHIEYEELKSYSKQELEVKYCSYKQDYNSALDNMLLFLESGNSPSGGIRAYSVLKIETEYCFTEQKRIERFLKKSIEGCTLEHIVNHMRGNI